MKNVRFVMPLGFAVAVAAAVCAPPDAQANTDLSASVYADVKDIVEELIRDEVGSSVADAVAKSPVLAFYFKGSLERLKAGAWGNLTSSLRSDIGELLQDAVYKHALRAFELGGSADVAAPDFSLKWFATQVRECALLPNCAMARNETYFSADCLDLAENKFSQQVACELARATSAAVAGSQKAVEDSTRKIAAEIFLAATMKQADLAIKQTVRSWFADPSGLRKAHDVILKNDWLGKIARSESEIQCSSLKDSLDELRTNFQPAKPNVGLLACMAWLAEGDAANGVTSLRERMVVFEYKSARISSPLANILVATSSEPSVQSLLKHLDTKIGATCVVPTSDDCKTWQEWLKGSTSTAVHVSFDDSSACDLQKNGIGDCGSAQAAVTALEALRHRDELLETAKTLSATLGGNSPSPELLRLVARAHSLISAFGSAAETWKDASGKHSQFGAIFRAVAKEAAARCSGADASCKAILAMSRMTDTAETTTWMRAIQRGDARWLAGAVISKLLAEVSGIDPSYSDFLAAFAAYVLDGGDDTDQRVVLREAFRASARRLLERMNGTGFPEPGRFSLPFWKAFIVPSLSLRLSASPTYDNAVGAERVRYVASINEATARFAATRYLGLQVSLFDLVAPLTEYVYRKPLDYRDQRKIWWDFLHPRVDLMFSMPEFSRKLAVSVGAGLRPLDLVKESCADDKGTKTDCYRYKSFLDGAVTGEANVAVTLLF